MSTGEPENPPMMIVHAEAAAGSSLINLKVENADAAQLFALAGMLQMNAEAAMLGQMAHDARVNQSPIDIVRGGLPNARN